MLFVADHDDVGASGPAAASARVEPTIVFESSTLGKQAWPRHPRASTNLADHRSALELVGAGLLNPENRWQPVKIHNKATEVDA
ncbi:hypothetical protein E3O47_04050 [Cryobacterium sp. TMT2-17-1]|uniref:hypothetical protein n=1 Tax=unclassified Cryobacterium TaxID=2649013 RepID=UPI00106910ED|nr:MULTISPECIES: hypothetical protein [unclassified Cryobacterium]TFB60626.1 hypothetical protein E3N94_02105 [Cryobacterium sp. Sr3]TFC53115.1 hypothetical protein E3O47_04050 [Cryobacterium sp. TMT2-17-1]